MIKQAYINGFMRKCAELGIDGRLLIKHAAPLTVTDPPVHPEGNYHADAAFSAVEKPLGALSEDEAKEARKLWTNVALRSILAGLPTSALPYPKPHDYNPEFATAPQYLGDIIGATRGGETLGADLQDAPLGREVQTPYPFSPETSNVVNRAVFDKLYTPATPGQTNNVYNAIRTGLGK